MVAVGPISAEQFIMQYGRDQETGKRYNEYSRKSQGANTAEPSLRVLPG